MNLESKTKIELVNHLDNNESKKNKSFLFRAAMLALNSIKQARRYVILGGLGAITSAGVFAQETKESKALDSKITRQTYNTSKSAKINRDSTVFYGEKIKDKELKYSANSLEEMKDKYKKAEIRAYEVVVKETRFKRLREGKYADATEEETISYNGKLLKVRIFKKGHGKELLQYIKEVYGVEANKIIKEWGINEDSYETLKNLSRDQFVRAVVHGQNKEHTKWVYLAGGQGDKGFPYIVLHTNKDGYLEGFAGCNGNISFERVSADCVDVKEHNRNVD